MEENKYGIILDGKMDEPIWDTVETYSGFVGLQIGAGSNGNALHPLRLNLRFCPLRTESMWA